MNIHEETLKIARNLIKKDPSLTDWVISKFPELKESEDDRIRKALIEGFNKLDKSAIWYNGITNGQILAWLEKQDEHADFLSKIQVGDNVTRNEAGILVNISQLNRVSKKRRKQGEQKSADKVEPKFEIGDWITNGILVGKIDEINKLGYHAYFGDYFADVSDIENWHKWTIQDAKDGDVLVSESNCGLNTWYCIFKSLDDDESMTVHCYLARDGRFQTTEELCFNKDPRNVKPATKEQRDLLFQKMKEAGYEWDAEKKELKKVEQKPADNIVTFKDKLLELFQKFRWKCTPTNGDIIDYVDAHIQELIDTMQKSDWSEEDEKMIENIIDTINMSIEDCDVDDIGTKARFTLEKEREWLKSLKDRYTWKPSEEQMEALDDFIYAKYPNIEKHGAAVKSLYQDLKKLREE